VYIKRYEPNLQNWGVGVRWGNGGQYNNAVTLSSFSGLPIKPT
jgi:hypothetical protein